VDVPLKREMFHVDSPPLRTLIDGVCAPHIKCRRFLPLSFSIQGGLEMDGNGPLRARLTGTEYPIWKWDHNSCALDQVLLIVLLLALNDNSWLTQGNIFHGLLRDVIHTPTGKRRKWLPRNAVDRYRNANRTLWDQTYPESQIGPNSAVDVILSRLIPKERTKVQYRLEFTCELCHKPTIGARVTEAECLYISYPQNRSDLTELMRSPSVIPLLLQIFAN
jgi:hypothetical protein